MLSPAQDPHHILKTVFGYDRFRPGQDEAVEAVLAGRHVLCVMPTGAGKSLCFQVPALVKGGLAIVVSPLVALMQDQVEGLKLAGIAADTIHSARSREDNVAAWRRAAAGETRLLYLSPERLMTARMLAALARLPVSLIAIDEAHCISQWGPSFRPDYVALEGLRAAFPQAPIMALTATADGRTRADIAARLFSGPHARIVLGFDRPNIALSVARKADWKKQLLDFLSPRTGESGIVYCLSRQKTEDVAALLRQHGIDALAYHAGMDQSVRDTNQSRFMREPIVMVATIAFGMGIDKPDVRFVVHCDLPATLEAYYQEIGRAGRDGGPAHAHMLFGAGDIRLRRLFIARQDTDAAHQAGEQRRLEALIGYCEAHSCRRQILLGYFGEPAQRCGHCDVCNPALSGKMAATGHSAARANAEALPAEAEAVFARLRALRRELAAARRVPPYVIFSDRSLKEMALLRPTTLSAMAQIHGVGAAKLAAFGRVFLDAICHGG